MHILGVEWFCRPVSKLKNMEKCHLPHIQDDRICHRCKFRQGPWKTHALVLQELIFLLWPVLVLQEQAYPQDQVQQKEGHQWEICSGASRWKIYPQNVKKLFFSLPRHPHHLNPRTNLLVQGHFLWPGFSLYQQKEHILCLLHQWQTQVQSLYRNKMWLPILISL